MINVTDAEKIIRERFGFDLVHTGSTHLPVLVSALSRTKGAVLELGTGLFSSPVLHELCAEQGRELVSYEDNKKYYDLAITRQSELHPVNFIASYDLADIKREWGVVLIDHHPPQRRVTDIIRVANCADYIVCHDAEPRNDHVYRYSTVSALFKYNWTYDKFKTHTTVFSNRMEWK